MKQLWLCLFLIVGVVSADTQVKALSVDSAHYNFEYHVHIPALSQGTKRLRLWIPYPAEDAYQKIVKADVQSPFPWSLKREAKYGNQMVYVEVEAPQSSFEIVLNFEIERRLATGFSKDQIRENGSLNPSLYSRHDRWIRTNKVIRRIAEMETKGIGDDSSVIIQALYNYVYKTLTYDKSGKGWGQGDPIWACTNKRGNCTDFHSLFASLARHKGIPTRFEIGVPIPHHLSFGEIPGYHCWVHVYDPQKGWIPFDISEAKKAGEKSAYYGKLPNDRILFTVGRGLVLNPRQDGDPLNYFIYPYAEVDGKVLNGVKKQFHFKKIAQSS